jgi:FeS assembly SUF system protein
MELEDEMRHEVADTHSEPQTSAPGIQFDYDAMSESVLQALRTVYDPEIPLNIYDLGLIYRIEWTGPGVIEIDMTLTAPGCPVAGEMTKGVQVAVAAIDGVEKVKVDLVFDPPWDQSRMSEEAQLELGLM